MKRDIRPSSEQVTFHISPKGRNISPANGGYHREAISHSRICGNISLLSTTELTAAPAAGTKINYRLAA
jgi:hypothetical protein